jgi:hypothetical protein
MLENLDVLEMTFYFLFCISAFSDLLQWKFKNVHFGRSFNLLF